ncbi:hypothetical protein [Streptomyces sp. NPDC050560]|uniref:hypothetical protein n=1 Tax=Streptomyces sp. NPDC050560 TaxID=3365630 RepID=UPI003789F085
MTGKAFSMTLSHSDLADVDLGHLGSAVADWKTMVGHLKTLAHEAKLGMQAKSENARWAGVNATVTRGFVQKTAKEVDDLHAEAQSIYTVLDDAYRQLLQLQKQIVQLLEDADSKGYVVADTGEGSVTLTVRTYAGEPVNESSETKEDLNSHRERINACLSRAAEVDQVVTWALGRIHGNDDHNPGHHTYDSLADATNDLISQHPFFEFPPAQAEDVNRPLWGSAEPTAGDRETFMLAATGALPYMAMKKHKIAADLLEHWLDNGGEPVEVSPTKMMTDLDSFKANVGNEIKPGKFDSGWKSSSVAAGMGVPAYRHGEAEQDWYYALNGYQYRVRGETVERHGKLTGEVTVDVYKRYNWGNPAGGKGRGDIGWGPVSVRQNDMARLNTTGLAQDYDVIGHETLHVG